MRNPRLPRNYLVPGNFCPSPHACRMILEHRKQAKRMARKYVSPEAHTVNIAIRTVSQWTQRISVELADKLPEGDKRDYYMDCLQRAIKHLEYEIHGLARIIGSDVGSDW